MTALGVHETYSDARCGYSCTRPTASVDDLIAFSLSACSVSLILTTDLCNYLPATYADDNGILELDIGFLKAPLCILGSAFKLALTAPVISLTALGVTPSEPGEGISAQTASITCCVDPVVVDCVACGSTLDSASLVAESRGNATTNPFLVDLGTGYPTFKPQSDRRIVPKESLGYSIDSFPVIRGPVCSDSEHPVQESGFLGPGEGIPSATTAILANDCLASKSIAKMSPFDSTLGKLLEYGVVVSASDFAPLASESAGQSRGYFQVDSSDTSPTLFSPFKAGIMSFVSGDSVSLLSESVALLMDSFSAAPGKIGSNLERAPTTHTPDVFEAGEGNPPSWTAFKIACSNCGALSNDLLAADGVFLEPSLHRHDCTACAGLDGKLLSSTRLPPPFLERSHDIHLGPAPLTIKDLLDYVSGGQGDLKALDNSSECGFATSLDAPGFDLATTDSALDVTVTTGIIFLFDPSAALEEQEPFGVTPLVVKVTDSCPVDPVSLAPDFCYARLM